MARKEMNEKKAIEMELSFLMETTLKLEEDLNSFAGIDEE